MRVQVLDMWVQVQVSICANSPANSLMPHCIWANEVQRGEISSQRQHSYIVAETFKLCVLRPQITCLSSHTSYRLCPPHTWAPHSERPPRTRARGSRGCQGTNSAGRPRAPKAATPFLTHGNPALELGARLPWMQGRRMMGAVRTSRNDHRCANGTEKQELGQLQCWGFCDLFPIFSSLSKCDLCC